MPWYNALAHHASKDELQDAGITLLPLSRAARDGDIVRVKASCLVEDTSPATAPAVQSWSTERGTRPRISLPVPARRSFE